MVAKMMKMMTVSGPFIIELTEQVLASLGMDS
jgi:hypothetical protein